MEGEYGARFLQTTKAAAAAATGTHEYILHQAYEAVIQEDFEGFGAFLADDIELNILGFGVMNGSWKGRAAVVAATRRNFAEVEGQQPQIDGIIHQGDTVAVLLRESGVFKSSGQAYNIRGVQWFTFADGKIKKIDEIIASIAEN
jgi:ketosteroid isomerase-like protein